MYQKYLKETKHVEGRIFLEEKWAISSDCLLRVAFFDKYMPDLAYIVGYSEKSREYILKKFDINNGTVFLGKTLIKWWVWYTSCLRRNYICSVNLIL